MKSLLILRPTAIITVETTANAKIFFETHFNAILSGGITERSLRRRTFEQSLLMEPMTSEQRATIRERWARRESEHLRRTRAQKKMSSRKNANGHISVGGYEVVKVLGKGSFGVVRLVRKRELPLETELALSSRDLTGLTQQPASKSRLTGQDNSAGEPRALSRNRMGTHLKKEVYAMKVIRKSEMLKNSQEAHLRAERDFLVASEGSRWIVPLIASFQDNTNLYLVMEYMVGGDFLGLLIREHTLDEDVAKWYIAEMILCVEEAHAMKWIHRDVKPDNFLIDHSGHLKISDFGLAFDGHWSHDQSYYHEQRYSLVEKLGIQIEGDSLDQQEGKKLAASAKFASLFRGGRHRHEKAAEKSAEEETGPETVLDWRNRTGMRHMGKSVVGTSQYMAPEVVRGDRYDGRCDWWSIGIILFEVSS